MRRRFPLLLKKRGRRRSGSPVWGRIGEALYHALFATAGVIGLWWLFSDVLLPELRLYNEARTFTQSTCQVLGAQVAERPGLAQPEFAPELLVEYSPNGAPPLQVWTRHGVGRDTPSQVEAKSALKAFTIGQSLPCWFDPANPERVLLSVRPRWWPWLVVSIPITLLAVGAVGLVRTLVASRATPEQRSALLTSGLELIQLESEVPRPTIASGLPTLHSSDDSPGVLHAHRLPADTARGWRVGGMAILCGVWNLLVALFAYQIGSDYLSTFERIGLAVLVAAPLAIISVRLTLTVWRDARGGGAVAPTRIEIDRQPLRIGETASLALLQYGQLRLRELRVSLVCEEIATYRQGTDARTATFEAYREELLVERRLSVAGDEPLSREAPLTLQANAPHSFVSPNNEIRWAIEVQITPTGRNRSTRRFPLVIYPAIAKSRPETQPAAANHDTTEQGATA